MIAHKTAAKGDPFWMRAKYPGTAKDGTPFRRGDKVLYYPRTKTIMVGPAAEKAWRDFESQIADERTWNMYANLRDDVIRLAHEHPDLRRHLVPLLREAAPGSIRA